MVEATYLEYSTSFLVLCVTLFSFLWWSIPRRPKCMPPGPGMSLPFIGHIYLLGKDPRKTISEWGKKYGSMFTFYLGSRLVLVLNGFEVIRDTHVKYGSAFNDRTQMFITENISENKGLAFTNGKHWKEQRKVSVEILRHLGMGKTILSHKVQEEISEFLKAIAAQNGQPFLMHDLVQLSVANNMCSVIFGKRFDYDDPLFQKSVLHIRSASQLLGVSSVYNFFPIIKYLPGDFFNIKKVLGIMRSIENEFIRPQLEKHCQEFQEGNESDFIFAYIQQIHNMKAKGLPTTINEENVIKIVLEMFFGGTDTTSNGINWTVLLLANHPDIADKCYNEIKRVVGTERLPAISDKPHLKYTYAVILEMLRWANITDLGPEHCLAYDLDYRGYHFPKGTTLFANVESALRDPEVWKDPYDFKPERFIGSDGDLLRFEEFIPFSIGRRACPGASIAYMELFLYITTLAQRFQFLAPEGEPIPPVEGELGLSYGPKKVKIRCVPRN